MHDSGPDLPTGHIEHPLLKRQSLLALIDEARFDV